MTADGDTVALYNFDGPQGYRGLRQLVVDKLAERPAITCTVDDVLITSGSGQAIDLVNGLLLERGDTVILEEFTYGGALTKLKRLGVNIIGAPLDDDGLKIDALGQILEDLSRKGTRAKYVYTIPTVQNPTGSILPRQRREELLALTRKHGVPAFEDECYADLTWDGAGPPSLYAMDPQQVIHSTRRARAATSSISGRSRRPWPHLCASVTQSPIRRSWAGSSPASEKPTAAPARSTRWSSPSISRRISASMSVG